MGTFYTVHFWFFSALAIIAALAMVTRRNPVAAALWLVRLGHYLRFLKQRDAADDTLQQWRGSWCALVLAQGSMWGLAAWTFWALGMAYHHVSLILIVYSYCLGSVQLLATQSKVFMVFITLVLSPTIVRVASDTSQEFHLQLAVVLTLMFCITVLMARWMASSKAACWPG